MWLGLEAHYSARTAALSDRNRSKRTFACWLRGPHFADLGGSDRGDGLHLDQEGLLDQPIDHQKRIRRVFAVEKHPWKLPQTEFHEFRDVLRMHEKGRELHDVAPARTC